MVTEFAIALAKEFGPKTTISGEKVHDYLGMELDFGTCGGTMIISMIKYLQKIIDEFPEVLRGTKSCPTEIIYSRYGMTRRGNSSVRRWPSNSIKR